MAAPSPQQLRDLALDLAVEERKLDALVDSLAALGVVAGDRLRVDAAALRLQSLYTGIERCSLQVSRVLNGGTPDGGDWHRRLLERMGQPTEERPAVLREASIASLQVLLLFRHLVRHLYAYELQPEPVERLRILSIALWPKVQAELNVFQGWLTSPWE
ncbi:MAG: hypothetical protein WCL59_10560 [Cyanobium sp. ELA507]